MSWTDERVALLKRLWGEGKTAAEIASELGGVTRNAVIGKAHRLKLSNRVSPIQQNKKPVAVPANKPVQIIEKKIRQTLEQDNNRTAIPLTELDGRACRWPLGDPRDEKFGFCGDECVASLPYCDSHAKIAYQAAGRARPLQAADFDNAPKQASDDDEMQESKTAAKKR